MAGDLIVDKVAASAAATKTSLMRGLAKGWANLNGTGTIALRDSLNVASATDNGAGDYSFNWSSAMSNGNYKASFTGSGKAAVESYHFPSLEWVTVPTGSIVRGVSFNVAGTKEDSTYFTTDIAGDLA